MPTFNDRERIRALLAQVEPRLRRRFRALVRRFREELPVRELEQLVALGQGERALELGERLAAQFATEVAAVTFLAAQQAAEFIGESLRLVVDFDQTNVLAVRAVRAARLDLIREFTAQQREAVREALVFGTQGGFNPRDQARVFRDSVGLTRRQVAAVNNFERMLREGDAEALTRKLRDRRFDPTVRRAIESGERLSTAQVARMVERYRQRFEKFRAETIARTEALRAVHEGTEMAFAQATEAGDLDAAELAREWNTALDERVRGSHSTMQGQLRDFGVPFRSGNGHELRYPGDPLAPGSETINCRCVVSTRIQVRSVQRSSALTAAV